LRDPALLDVQQKTGKRRSGRIQRLWFAISMPIEAIALASEKVEN